MCINYYLHIDEAILGDESAYMEFTYANGNTHRIPLSEAQPKKSSGKTYYFFTATVSAKEMNDTITGQFFYTGGSSSAVQYSVKQYADYVLNNAGYDSVRPLVRAMMNYGTYAQIHFGYNAENPVTENASVEGVTAADLSSFAFTGAQGTAKAPLLSASLILKSETTMRLYFQPDADVENLSITMNGQPMTVTKKSNYSYVDVTNISAKDLDTNYTVVVNDGFETVEVTLTPMTYCYNVLNNESAYAQSLVDLCKALYLYNQAANDHFK